MMSPRPTMWFCVSLGVFSLLTACSKSDEEAASEVLQTYLDAELAGDKETAYKLISTADKRVQTLAQYKLTNPEEEAMRERFGAHFSHEVVSVIIKGIEAEAVVKATGPDFAKMRTEGWSPKEDAVPLSQQFRTYTLVKEGEHWRVDAGLTLEEVGRALVSLLESFAAAGAEGTRAVWKAWWENAQDIVKPPTLDPPPKKRPTDQPPTPEQPGTTPPKITKAPPGTPPTEPPTPPTIDTPPDKGPSTPEPPKVTPPPTPAAEGSGQWTQRRIRSSGRDTEDVFLTLRAQKPLPSLIPQTPVLDLRCVEGVFSAMIHTRTLINSDFGRFDETTVTVQMGQGEPVQAKVRLTEHHQTLVWTNAKDMLAKLEAHDGQTLLVTFTAPIDERHQMQFDLTGLREVSGPVKSGCGL